MKCGQPLQDAGFASLTNLTKSFYDRKTKSDSVGLSPFGGRGGLEGAKGFKRSLNPESRNTKVMFSDQREDKER